MGFPFSLASFPYSHLAARAQQKTTNASMFQQNIMGPDKCRLDISQRIRIVFSFVLKELH